MPCPVFPCSMLHAPCSIVPLWLRFQSSYESLKRFCQFSILQLFIDRHDRFQTGHTLFRAVWPLTSTKVGTVWMGTLSI